MNAAQMLAAAGEPNTTAGRAKFHQRFTSKAAFDAWYNSKKEYGGGLTDGIAFPQQPDASSRRVPYYDKGGFFPPNVMPWNGPVGFYEHGGMTDEIAFPQQPTEHINFSAFPWQPKYDMGGLPGGSNDMPCLECGGNMAYGGYMQPGGYVQAPDADAYFAAQDAAANYPAQGTNINYDYSKVTDPNTSLLNNYTADELNRMGANLPVANPVQDARFKKINDYNKEHPIIPADGGLFKYSSPKSGQEGERLQYANGKYQPYTPPVNPVVVNNRYGGYMQTGGTTQMDQGQYTNGMAQDYMNYMKSLADFNMSAQPMPMGNVQEAGYGAYGYEMQGNTNSDFNTLDMNAVDQMSSMQDRIDALKNKQTSIFDLGRNLTNIGSSIYQKPMSYKTKTVGSGMMKYGGLNKYAPGGTSVPGYTDEEVAASDDWFAKQVAESAANEARNNYYKQISGNTAGNNSGTNAGTTNTNTANTNTTANTSGMTADELAYFRGMMRGSNQGNYAPSWQTQQQQALANQYLGDLFKNTSLTGFKYRHGPLVQKGKMSFRTYYDPSTGKNVTVPTDQSKQARNYDSTKTGQEAKGPGFIKNLIAKNKQRKAGKQATKDNTQPPTTNQQAFTSGYPSVHIAPTNPNSIFPQNYPTSPYDANMPQHFLPTSNMNPAGFPVWNNVNLEPAKGYGPGLAFGGTPYEEGAELEMDDEAIANYLAMGGTLEYLD